MTRQSCFIIATLACCGLTPSLTESRCCDTTKILAPALMELPPGFGDEVTPQVVDHACLNERAKIQNFHTHAPNFEVKRGFTESDPVRYVVDLLNLGQEQYWNMNDGTPFTGHRVAALRMGGAPSFQQAWYGNFTSSPSYVCQDMFNYKMGHMFETLKGRNGWFVILAESRVLGAWQKWLNNKITPLMNSTNCGSGCMIAVGESTRNYAADVLAALSSMNITENIFAECTLCDRQPDSRWNNLGPSLRRAAEEPIFRPANVTTTSTTTSGALLVTVTSTTTSLSGGVIPPATTLANTVTTTSGLPGAPTESTVEKATVPVTVTTTTTATTSSASTSVSVMAAAILFATIA